MATRKQRPKTVQRTETKGTEGKHRIGEKVWVATFVDEHYPRLLQGTIISAKQGNKPNQGMWWYKVQFVPQTRAAAMKQEAYYMNRVFRDRKKAKMRLISRGLSIARNLMAALHNYMMNEEET